MPAVKSSAKISFMTTDEKSAELTFDPATPEEWDALRELGHRMLDDMANYLENIRDTAVWQQIPDRAASSFLTPVPRVGIGQKQAYERFLSDVLPYHNGNLHPRFFGWVRGNGTAYAMLAEMLSAGMNAHLGGFNNAPAMVERQVINWFASLLGFEGASGLFVTGGTMANTLSLAVARYSTAEKNGYDVRALGVQSWPGATVPAPMVFYGSTETHNWAMKASEWLGLGRRAFRAIPCNDEFQIDLGALKKQIEEDRAAGLLPFCVIGTAGTVNTGACDDLTSLADIAQKEQLWFHVDGAFGALLKLSPKYQHFVSGIERADSLGFDLHKWGSMPFECGCVLVRNADIHKRAFATPADYLKETSRGVAAGGAYFAERGLDLTRGFKALKVWMSLQADGIDKLVSIIEQNISHVQYLKTVIGESDRLELLAPSPLNVVCFRYIGTNLESGALNALNSELLLRLQERGISVPSSTIIRGTFSLRVAHVNHRAKREDIDALVSAVLAIGAELERDG